MQRRWVNASHFVAERAERFGISVKKLNAPKACAASATASSCKVTPIGRRVQGAGRLQHHLDQETLCFGLSPIRWTYSVLRIYVLPALIP